MAYAFCLRCLGLAYGLACIKSAFVEVLRQLYSLYLVVVAEI